MALFTLFTLVRYSLASASMPLVSHLIHSSSTCHTFLFVRVSDSKVPTLIGLGLDEIDRWWASNHQRTLGELGGFAEQMLVAAPSGERGKKGGGLSFSVE